MDKPKLTRLLYVYTHSGEETKQYIRDRLVRERVTVTELLDASDLLPLPAKMFLPLSDLINCVNTNKRKGAVG
ncbi:hypothetical protein Tfer_0849 [Thermincola ferriacetica]|uniref:Uncharacterized protein n=1 Tax=Thermincola ferriacetica TaxID=281456 RepID=A0A0L6W5B6_9FIRM|nr:hypothetical protein [Thermincola ferriacetica]KNZ70289.1 hypothetical protein Tfer_0849 [Thermincola ferriacetica]